MMNASDARKATKGYSNSMNYLLHKVERVIKESAEKGKRSCYVLIPQEYNTDITKLLIENGYELKVNKMFEVDRAYVYDRVSIKW